MLICLPVLDQGDINGASGAARSEVERSRRPQQGDAVGCVVCVQRGFLEEGLHILRKLKLFIIIRQRLLTLNWCKKGQSGTFPFSEDKTYSNLNQREVVMSERPQANRKCSQ